MSVTRKQEREYSERMTAVLVSFGAVASESPDERLVLSTRAGPLRARVYEDWVAMRFDDVDEARRVLNVQSWGSVEHPLNPYSGKYNVQIGFDKRADDWAPWLAFNERLLRGMLAAVCETGTPT